MYTKRLNSLAHVTRSLSGFTRDKQIVLAALLRPGGTQAIIGVTHMLITESALKQTEQKGFVPRVIRPFPVGNDQLRCALLRRSAG